MKCIQSISTSASHSLLSLGPNKGTQPQRQELTAMHYSTDSRLAVVARLAPSLCLLATTLFTAVGVDVDGTRHQQAELLHAPPEAAGGQTR